MHKWYSGNTVLSFLLGYPFFPLPPILALSLPFQKLTNVKNLVYILSCFSSFSYMLGKGFGCFTHEEKPNTGFNTLPFTHSKGVSLGQQYSTNAFFLMVIIFHHKEVLVYLATLILMSIYFQSAFLVHTTIRHFCTYTFFYFY